VRPIEQASFRDPAGRLFFYQGRVIRALNVSGAASLEEVWQAAEKSLKSAAIVSTRFLDPAESKELLADPSLAFLKDLGVAALVEHEPAPFANYPHEWPPEMLHAAGALTMRLARNLLKAGIGVKDATPTNVMFWGSKPVFLDVLSFEKRDPHDPTWLPNAQFVRNFLLPLLVNRRYGIPLNEIFLARRDGLEPEEVYPLLRPLQRLNPQLFSLVSFPVWFGKRSAESQTLYKPRLLKNAEQAQFVLDAMLKRQERALDRVRPKTGRESSWSDYMTGNNNYSSGGFDAKVSFVRDCLATNRPAKVLDIGCNTGVFSMLAAEQGASVVSVDYDPVVIGNLWRVAQEKQANVLPLVVNLGRPSPALGWSNGECRSFLDRATGAFDAIFMLALIHHLLVSERVPLPQIFEMARRLTKKWLIVEYVGPSDSMFVRLTRGRGHLHEDYNQKVFEETALRYFRIVRSEEVTGSDRRLYLMEVPG